MIFLPVSLPFRVSFPFLDTFRSNRALVYGNGIERHGRESSHFFKMTTHCTWNLLYNQCQLHNRTFPLNTVKFER